MERGVTQRYYPTYSVYITVYIVIYSVPGKVHIQSHRNPSIYSPLTNIYTKETEILTSPVSVQIFDAS